MQLRRLRRITATTLVLQIACTATGRDSEPADDPAREPAAAPVRAPDRVSAQKIRPAPLPSMELHVEVIARAGERAEVHALVDGWIAVEEFGRVMLFDRDGSMHDDPQLSLGLVSPLDFDRRVRTIAGRWPDALYAVVGPKSLVEEADDDPTPAVFHWKDRWVAIDNETRVGRRRDARGGPPRWLYRKITPWHDGTLLAHRVHYDVVELSDWHVFRAEEHDKLWILGAKERPLPFDASELALFDSTPSGIAFAVDVSGKIQRCSDRECSVVAHVEPPVDADGIATVGDSAVLWGVETDCLSDEVLFGTCMTEIGPAAKTTSVLPNLHDIATMSASLDRTLWITVALDGRRSPELWRRTEGGELRHVHVRFDDEDAEFELAHARDRSEPLIVARVGNGIVFARPFRDASP